MPTRHQVFIGDSQTMPELRDCSVHLMVTSPPYPMIRMWDDQFCKVDSKIAKLWREQEKDSSDHTVAAIYDTMHENIARVWRETHRVLIDGGMACINIGDATRTVHGKFRLFPNHARTIETCERIGFTTLPYILWKKPTSKPKYKGKGAFLGSGFLPPNAYVTLDCEYILLFRKGNLRKFPRNDKVRLESRFTKKQRDAWFTQIWELKGTRQTNNEIRRRTAVFPDEIANRLIQMFSVKGDTVLDPFLGSGTTMRAAIRNKRNSIGYEIDASLTPLIQANTETVEFSIMHREPLFGDYGREDTTSLK